MTQGAWLPYLALEGYHTDGYRDNSFVDRYNSFNKITTTLPDGATVSIRAQAYGTEFGAPGYAMQYRSSLEGSRNAPRPTRPTVATSNSKISSRPMLPEHKTKS